MVLKLPKESREELVSDIQAYVLREIGEPIGNMAAENLLQFMIETLGPHVYNQAVQDARAAVSAQADRLDEELYALQRPLRKQR